MLDVTLLLLYRFCTRRLDIDYNKSAKPETKLLGGAQPVTPPNLYMYMNIIAWGPQVRDQGNEDDGGGGTLMSLASG